MTEIAQFKQGRTTWIAGVLFLLPLCAYLIVPFFTHLPEPIAHFLLTLTAVMGVHLLDRWYLFRDTVESLSEIKIDLKAEIQAQNAALLAASASLEAMSRANIVRVYHNRSSASADIARDVVDPMNSSILLMGISLNDFVRDTHEANLSKAWKTIEDFIRNKQAISAPQRGLDIKVLLIDPGCLGAQLRSLGEAREHTALAGRLADDVLAVAGSLHALELQAATLKAKTGVSIECRFYRSAPTLFLCHVDAVCYVQPYHFWARRSPDAPIPVVKYRRALDEAGYSIHSDMLSHFDWVWRNASIPVVDLLEHQAIGTDRGLAQCRVINIFTDRVEAEKRLRWVLDNAKETVWIQGISLQSFFRQDTELYASMFRLVEAGKVRVRVLVLNPNCEQAVLRAYREFLLQGQQGNLSSYKSSHGHESSTLYTDTERTKEIIRTMVRIIKARNPQWQRRVELSEYDSAPACFILRVDNSVFAEQYLYGKVSSETGVVLGKDMPLIEVVLPEQAATGTPASRDAEGVRGGPVRTHRRPRSIQPLGRSLSVCVSRSHPS
jgi:hypothetical protein